LNEQQVGAEITFAFVALGALLIMISFFLALVWGPLR
jgi:hypothetical protein